MLKKSSLAVVILGGIAALLSVKSQPSEWRYSRLLVTQLPKMPFRYFV